jgi:hypothetical protein
MGERNDTGSVVVWEAANNLPNQSEGITPRAILGP